MARANKPEPLDQATATAAMLALLVEDQASRTDEKHQPRKTEVLLAAAGLTAPQIAGLMGKNKDAVAKAITRGRAKGKPKRGRR